MYTCTKYTCGICHAVNYSSLSCGSCYAKHSTETVHNVTIYVVTDPKTNPDSVELLNQDLKNLNITEPPGRIK